MLKALNVHYFALVMFLLGFYVCLVGAKIIMAILISLSRPVLSNRVFVVLNNILGFALIFFAGVLLYEGVQYFSTGEI